MKPLKEGFIRASFVVYEMLESFLLKSLADEDLDNEKISNLHVMKN